MTQLSDNNTALIQQGASLMVKALIRQEGGTGNNGTVTQTGEYNDASILQNGTNNVATITQSGVGTAALPNVAIADQGGTGHLANIVQSGGAGNYAKVLQR